MDTEQIKLLIDLLHFQLTLMENPHNMEQLSHDNERANRAILKILNDYDSHLHYEFEHTGGTSRLTVSLDFSAKILPINDPLPDYLPQDIFARLDGKSVSQMIQILQDYNMPDSEIKPFLRRIFPADDAL